MSLRLAASARVAIAAVSIGVGAAACGGTDAPTATADGSTSVPSVSEEPTEPTRTTITSSTTDTPVVNPPAATVAPEPGVSEAEVTELEQQLDEIDRVLADLEAQLSED